MLRSIIWLVLLEVLACAYHLMYIQHIALQKPVHKLLLNQNSSTLVIVTSEKDLQIYNINRTYCPQYYTNSTPYFLEGNGSYLDYCDFELQKQGQLFLASCPNTDISIYQLTADATTLLQLLDSGNSAYRLLMIDQDFSSLIICRFHEKNFTVYQRNGEYFIFSLNISSEMVMQTANTRTLEYLATQELYIIYNSPNANSAPDFVSYNKIYHRKSLTQYQLVYEEPSGNIPFEYIFEKQDGQVYVITQNNQIFQILNGTLQYTNKSFNETIISCYQIENSVLVIGTAYFIYFLDESNFTTVDIYQFGGQITKMAINNELLVAEINQSKLEIQILIYTIRSYFLISKFNHSNSDHHKQIISDCAIAKK